MAKGKELTYALYMIMEDGSVVEFDKLTTEQRAQWQANVRNRLSRTMSDYYSQHMDEYRRL